MKKSCIVQILTAEHGTARFLLNSNKEEVSSLIQFILRKKKPFFKVNLDTEEYIIPLEILNTSPIIISDVDSDEKELIEDGVKSGKVIQMFTNINEEEYEGDDYDG